ILTPCPAPAAAVRPPDLAPFFLFLPPYLMLLARPVVTSIPCACRSATICFGPADRRDFKYSRMALLLWPRSGIGMSSVLCLWSIRCLSAGPHAHTTDIHPSAASAGAGCRPCSSLVAVDRTHCVS